MKISERIKNAINAFNSTNVKSLNDDDFYDWLTGGQDNKNKSEATYYTCLKMLSETIGKMPLKYYQDTKDGRIKANYDETYDILANSPNKFMTPSVFWGTVELNRNHYGNAYVLMRKEIEYKGKYATGNKLRDIWVLPSENVSILVDDKGIFANKGNIYYQYSDKYSCETFIYKSEDIMHFKTFYTFDGIVGKSVIDILGTTLDGAKESQEFMNNLYKSGLSASMAMQYTGDLDEALIKKLQNKYGKYLTGAKNAGKVVPVPIGLQLTPLNTKLVDAQFFELKKYGALQIAAAFGIKPNHINDYSKSSYANSETQGISFLVDTMLYILKQYEEVINRKVLSREQRMKGFYYKFNENVILRTDSKTKMINVASGIDKGIYTINQAKDLYDLPRVEGGDVTIVNGTYIPLDQIGKQYEKSGENNE